MRSDFSILRLYLDCRKLKGELYGILSTLVIIFVHYVARSFCETIKLPQGMPKIILGILGIFPVYPG